jgi:hypothetical protein
MKASHHNEPPAGRLVRALIALSLAFSLLGASPVFALDTGDIVIASLKGEVHFVVGGSERVLRVGAALAPPATLRTGHDGAVELRQGATSVSVGPDTLLEFPALAQRGGPIDRIVQPSGNVFYDIGRREGRKLRVETPYLVGVVKGTQFNVAAQDTGATISLFEGLLEIRASDDSSMVDIKAGEVASRLRGDQGISVIKMEDKAPASQRPPASPGSGARPAPVDVDDLLASRGVTDQPVASEVVDTFRSHPGAPPVATTADPAPVSAPPEVASAPPTSVVDVGVAPAVPVDTGTTVGGVDLDAGNDLGLGDDDSGNDGNGNAGSKSRGNGNGNSGNGDNSNHGREDDGVHGLAHKK